MRESMKLFLFFIAYVLNKNLNRLVKFWLECQLHFFEINLIVILFLFENKKHMDLNAKRNRDQTLKFNILKFITKI